MGEMIKDVCVANIFFIEERIDEWHSLHERGLFLPEKKDEILTNNE